MVNELYHHGVKGMRWGVRHDKRKVSKYSQKARIQRNYNAMRAYEYKKEGGKAFFDDDELWKNISRDEKAEYNKKAGSAFLETFEQAHLWNLAVHDISRSKTKNEAKEKFKKYKSKASWYVVTTDVGEQYCNNEFFKMAKG